MRSAKLLSDHDRRVLDAFGLGGTITDDDLAELRATLAAVRRRADARRHARAADA